MARALRPKAQLAVNSDVAPEQPVAVKRRPGRPPKSAKEPSAVGSVAVKSYGEEVVPLATRNSKPVTTLRPRQVQAKDAVFKRMGEGVATQLVALPTGVGKTMLATHISSEFNRVLFLVHRKELMEQAANAFRRSMPGASVGLVYQGEHDLKSRFTVGMIGTLNRRLDKMPKDAYDCIIIDEAHHAAAKTWRATVEHFDTKLRLGLTATPERADGAPLNDLFSEISYQMTIKEAVLEGLLVYPKAMRVKTKTSLKGVGKMAGDFNEKQLANVVNNQERNNAIVSAYLKVSPEHRKGLVFTAGVEHAQELAECFRQAGVAADWVSGDDPNRDQKTAKHSAGEIRVLCNAMLLTEGYDDPSIGIVMMARPTMSRTLYTQCIGRGLRLDEENGKEDCLILDFVDDSKRHSVMDAWNIMGVSGAHKAAKAPLDMFRQHKTRAENALDLWEDNYDIKLDFAQVELLIESVDLLAPPPRKYTNGTSLWMLDDPTPNQVALIQESGADCEGWTKGQAAQFINELPPSKKQAFLLLALGYDVLETTWTRGQAQTAIEDAKARGTTPDWSRANQIAPEYAKEQAAERRQAVSAERRPMASEVPWDTNSSDAVASEAWKLQRQAGGKAASDGSLRYLWFLEGRGRKNGVIPGGFSEVLAKIKNSGGAPTYPLVNRAIKEMEAALDANGVPFRR